MIPHILLQIVSVPILGSLIIFLVPSKIGRKTGWIAGFTLLYTTVLLCWVALRIYHGETVSETYLIGPKVNLNLLADGLSITVALIVNLCCVVLSFYSVHYVDHRIEAIYGEVDQATRLIYTRRFFSLFLFFSTGFMGISFATNLIAVYFFMEILTIIPLYFIMAQFGYSDFIPRSKVALMCLFWGIAGATFFLIGILLAYSQGGSFEISKLHHLAGSPSATWIILLILLGLFTKLAVFPLHVWMPWVHAEHPTCIAGLLAVYANIGAYVMVRVIIIPFAQDFHLFGLPIMVMALITMVYGSLLTLAQNDVKRFCACSTISQIAYSILGLGAHTVVSTEGGLLFFLSHIMGKTVLFSTAGIIVYATGIRDMRKMGGLVSRMPVTATLWIMGAMMLSAFPPFMSFPSEWIMFTGIFEAGIRGSSFSLAIAILGVSAISLTVTYTFLSVKRIFFGPLNAELSNEHIKDPPLMMTLPLLFLTTLSIILGLYPKPFLDLLHQVIGS
jgi:formate hydrogenlyase subunit 3/multisubunit Na+/H+ antiporter MnhD subunit